MNLLVSEDELAPLLKQLRHCDEGYTKLLQKWAQQLGLAARLFHQAPKAGGGGGGGSSGGGRVEGVYVVLGGTGVSRRRRKAVVQVDMFTLQTQAEYPRRVFRVPCC